MVIEKFVDGGVKKVKFVWGNEVKVAELAPRELVNAIATIHEVKLKSQFTMEPHIVKPKDKVNLNGWFEAPDRKGRYQVLLTIRGDNYLTQINIGTIEVSQESKEKLSANEIVDAVKSAFRGNVGSTYMADSTYYSASLDDIREVLNKTKIDCLPYIAEDADCDDFAFALMGAFHADPYKPEWEKTVKQAIFIAWVWWKQGEQMFAHALNLAVTGDKQVYLIEPQNDKIFTVPENWNLIVLMG